MIILLYSCFYLLCFSFFFFNDTATTEIYTLSLHDALPIWRGCTTWPGPSPAVWGSAAPAARSEEHTSELQSRVDLVCRLLLEKNKRSKQVVRLRRVQEAQRAARPPGDSA